MISFSFKDIIWTLIINMNTWMTASHFYTINSLEYSR
jgi:hypothetical protein